MPLKSPNRNFLLHTISIYCHPRCKATNCGEQTLALYRGLPKLHRMKSLVVTSLGRFKAPVPIMSHAIKTIPFPNPALWYRRYWICLRRSPIFPPGSLSFPHLIQRLLTLLSLLHFTSIPNFDLFSSPFPLSFNFIPIQSPTSSPFFVSCFRIGFLVCTSHTVSDIFYIHMTVQRNRNFIIKINRRTNFQILFWYLTCFG